MNVSIKSWSPKVVGQRPAHALGPPTGRVCVRLRGEELGLEKFSCVVRTTRDVKPLHSIM
jgi:hypothetical protein